MTEKQAMQKLAETAYKYGFKLSEDGENLLDGCEPNSPMTYLIVKESKTFYAERKAHVHVKLRVNVKRYGRPQWMNVEELGLLSWCAENARKLIMELDLNPIRFEISW